MSRPPSRRALLASVVTTVAVSTGGFQHVSNAVDRPAFESGTIPADYYDCHSVTRPEPDVPTNGDALAPLPYPSPPSATDSTEKDDSSDHASSSVLVDNAAAYATEFERAYRRNQFIAQFRNVTRTFDLRRTKHRTAAIGSSTNADAVMVAICYNLATGTRRSAADPRDEWDIRVTYYIDENFVLRARYDGVADELALEPDPRWEGDLVACVG